jgi:inositol-phosphate transport system ATP-binding protein
LGVTTILVTHDQTEATTMADRVVVMNGGRVEQEGAADDLYERPDTLFVASFIGSPPINLFEGEADAGVVKFHEASIALAESVHGPVVLGIRPESLQVSEHGTPAHVTAAEPMGREVLYTADSSFGVIRFLEAGAEPRHREGDNVHLNFSPASALLFDKASGRRMDAHITV